MSSLNKNDGNMCQKMAAMITAEATIYCLKEQKNTEYFEKCIKKRKDEIIHDVDSAISNILQKKEHSYSQNCDEILGQNVLGAGSYWWGISHR